MKIIRSIRAGLRLILLFGLTFIDIIILFTVFIFKRDIHWGMRFRKNGWAQQMMWVGGIKLTVKGEVPKEPHLVVVNHRSSIDPLINLADIICCPIAKIEFKSWPIIGQGAWFTGIVFVDRSSKESRLATRKAIGDTLAEGKHVLIYPEGGTHDLDLTRTFKKGSFEVAAERDFPVLPVAMEYRDRDDNWNHDTNFIQHFFKRFGKHRTYVELRYGPSIRSDNSWTLLRQSQAWINEQIEDMRSTWDGPNWRKQPTEKRSKTASQV